MPASPSLSLSAYLLLSTLIFFRPTPHPGADLKTAAFSQPLLASPDLLPQPRKVTLLAGLVRAWLGPQSGMARAGGKFCQRSRDVELPRIKEADPNNTSCPLPAIFSLSTDAAPWDGMGVGIRCVLPWLSFHCIRNDNCSDQTARPLTGAGEAANRGRRPRITRDR